jgi:signal transduction histidine kinase
MNKKRKSCLDRISIRLFFRQIAFWLMPILLVTPGSTNDTSPKQLLKQEVSLKKGVRLTPGLFSISKDNRHFFGFCASENQNKVNEAAITGGKNRPIKIATVALPGNNAWVYGLFMLIVLGLLYGIRRYELNRQKLKAQLEKEVLHSERVRLQAEMERLENGRLEEVDRLKSNFFANISHEFRTPLAVIMGMTETFESLEKTEYWEAIKLIRRNSKELLRLVEQMLDLSKAESGDLKLRLVHGDIVKYLQYLAESLQSYAATKQINLVFYNEVTSLYMDYDEEKLQHVVYNLLSNAIKFYP